MLYIFKKSLDTSDIPLDWKKSNVAPKYKTGDKQDPNNYRPVSLTCHICKILESLIKDYIVKYLDENNLINSTQHGFIRNKSCLSNLLTFTEYLIENIDNGDPVDVFYLDFKKAFDRVPIKLLMYKLRSIGINNNILNWIQNWLTGRTQRVVIEGKSSNWSEVLSGVPQGSVLGPILFTIYINDLGQDIINKILKFANDTKTFGRALNQNDTQILQEDLSKAIEWSKKWGMDFNTKKCKVMHIGKKNSSVDYFMEGTKLESVNVERDLGVLISNDLKVSSQCLKASNTANKTLGMIKRTFTSRNSNVIIPLYKSIVRLHLEYCVQTWQPYLKKDI